MRQLRSPLTGHWTLGSPPSYALAMLCQTGLAKAKAITSWDHHHHACAGALDIPTLILARSRLLSQPPMGRLGQTFLLFFGRGTGPKRSGAVLACFWTDFQPEPSILDPIQAVFDDLGPNRHFRRDLARPGTGREALRPAQGLAGRPWPSPYPFFLSK